MINVAVPTCRTQDEKIRKEIAKLIKTNVFGRRETRGRLRTDPHPLDFLKTGVVKNI